MLHACWAQSSASCPAFWRPCRCWHLSASCPRCQVRDDQYPYNYLDGAFNCTHAAGKCARGRLVLVSTAKARRMRT